MNDTATIPTQGSQSADFNRFASVGSALRPRPARIASFDSDLPVWNTALTGYETKPIEFRRFKWANMEADKTVADVIADQVSCHIAALKALGSGNSSRPLLFQSWLAKLISNCPENPWDELFKKLEQYRGYVDGWNGYDAPAPNQAAVDVARMFLSVMRDNWAIPTRVAPTAVGGIAITRRSGEKKVVVEFYNNGLISALFADDAQQTMSTRRITSDWRELENLTSDMREYLSA